MCPNSPVLKMLVVGSTTIFIYLLVFSMLSAVPVHAEPLKVSLLLGDTHSRSAIEAVKALTGELGNGKALESTGQLPEAASFNVYPGKDIRRQDLGGCPRTDDLLRKRRERSKFSRIFVT